MDMTFLGLVSVTIVFALLVAAAVIFFAWMGRPRS